MKVRTGNAPDLSDALDWAAVSPIGTDLPQPVLLQRYVQFRAVLTADSDASHSPVLRDVTLRWPGPTRIVDIAATLTTGPNKGIYEVRIDGAPLIKAVTGFIEVYRDVRSQGGKMRRLTAVASEELQPRNNGL
jgi:hypothetical protein